MSDDEIPALCANNINNNNEIKNSVKYLINNSLEDEDDLDDEDWEEMLNDDDSFDTKCLFCEKIFSQITLAIDHLKIAHDFDLPEIKLKFNLDDYFYIKMINYIRIEKPDAKKFLDANEIFWDDEKYLKPLESESWLMMDLDDLTTIQDQQSIKDNQSSNASLTKNLTETITLTVDQFRKLQGIINDLTNQLKEKDDLLHQASLDIDVMKSSYRNLLEQHLPMNGDDENVGCDNKNINSKITAGLTDPDAGYFNTYSHFSIHHDMLSDQIRTLSYKNAILNNSNIFRDKVVLDVGCGTGILSMFASQAGAKEVIAIDQSEIIYSAMDIVRTNRITNIKFIKDRLEDAKLPCEKVDAIISEWMGYFLLFEGMIDSVIYARKNYLKPNGIMLPSRCNISLVGYGDVQRYNESITFWKNVYGYDMSCMQNEVLKEPIIEVCKPEYVLTNANIIANFDLMKVDSDCTNFAYDFELIVKRDAQLTSLVGYFDTFFELPNHVEFTTSPFAKPTHWKQVIFYLPQMVNVKKDEVIKGRFICRRDRNDIRGLIFTIEYFNQVLKYALN
uniref:type I protein arginine methyltransferase n=1 Tax=Corethrella appendiculata TaxID=1370023 RepID=U5EY54_9DIPT